MSGDLCSGLWLTMSSNACGDHKSQLATMANASIPQMMRQLHQKPVFSEMNYHVQGSGG